MAVVHVEEPLVGDGDAMRVAADVLQDLSGTGAVIADFAEIEYKCSAFYDPADEISIRYDDPAIGITWPVASPMLSARDAAAKPLSEMHDRLPRYGAPTL